MKIICLLTPHLPVQIERDRTPALGSTPVIVGGRPWDPGAVLDCCPAAQEAGVSPGMQLSRAETLCPTARFLTADEPAYHAAHQTLEAAIRPFSDRVEAAGLGFFFVDVTELDGPADRSRATSTGSAPRAAGRLQHVARRLAAAGKASSCPDVRVGVASNRFTAEQAAWAAPPGGWCPVAPGQERAFLAPLPITALPADTETTRRLYMLGVRSVGALAALPRAAIVRQFGPPAGFLHDLASGRDPRPLRVTAPPLVLEGAHSFEPPVTGLDPVTAHTRRILAALAADLSRRGYQAEGLRVQIDDEKGERQAAAAPLNPPTADIDRLGLRAGALLERLAPHRPVVDLRVSLYPLRPSHWGAVQLALFAPPSDDRRRRLQETLRRLRERFGEMIIVVAALLGPPLPRPIQVTTDLQGNPCALVWPDRILPVTRVYEHWRERRRWWARPLMRDYYRAETADGQVRVVFRDRSTDHVPRRTGDDRWWLERRYL